MSTVNCNLIWSCLTNNSKQCDSDRNELIYNYAVGLEEVEYRVPIGQGKLEIVREFVWTVKVRKRSGKNIIFKKSGKMILGHADCRYL